MIHLFLFEKGNVSLTVELTNIFNQLKNAAFLSPGQVKKKITTEKEQDKHNKNKFKLKLPTINVSNLSATDMTDKISHKFSVSPDQCVLIASSEAILDLGNKANMAIILLNFNHDDRMKLKNLYNPLYICDSVEDLISFLNLIKTQPLTIEDIKSINNDTIDLVIDVKALKEKEQKELGSRLFCPYQATMQGRNLDNFIAQFTNEKPHHIEVAILSNKLNKYLGFILFIGHHITFPTKNDTKNKNANNYLVIEGLACLLPEVQSHYYFRDTLIKVFGNFHVRFPQMNLVLFESMINYRSYKAFCSITKKNTFPSPDNLSTPAVEQFVDFLREHLNYKLIGNDPYVVQTTSNLAIKEYPDMKDKIGWFYINKTQQKPNVGLLILSCFYLMKDNSLGLAPTNVWSTQLINPIASYNKAKKAGRLNTLSQIIKSEIDNLTPKLHDMPKADMHRTTLLWYFHFNKGVCLSSGGVENSFIKMDELIRLNQNLRQFSMYRSDRAESTNHTQDDIKEFLIEEEAISKNARHEELNFSFCLGSHEGSMRVARCIYKQEKNNGMLYPLGSYGFMAAGVAVMTPFSYKVYMVDIDRNNGEKISTSDLRKMAKTHRTAKTLFLELKTTAGVVYTESELANIISICKEYGIFLLADAAHINMHFNKKYAFPDVVSLCQKQDFHDFAVIYTCSKTYGLERARVGFIVSSQKCRIPEFYVRLEIDFYRVQGSLGDLPFEAARHMFDSSLLERQGYLSENAQTHRYNMNLMLAYIEGIESRKIDEDLREKIKMEIPAPYHRGTEGIRVTYKPQSGIQMKIDVAGLQKKYLSNIRMFNSEIFSYALNKMADVITLHSYQILDPEGFGMRLSFAKRQDVHKGMMAMHDFVASLSDQPSPNPFMPDIALVEDWIVSARLKRIEENIKLSRTEAKYCNPHLLLFTYKQNILQHIPSHIRVSNNALETAVNNAATVIQHAWKRYRNVKDEQESKSQETITQHNTERFTAKL